jgi:hypothetical protein
VALFFDPPPSTGRPLEGVTLLAPSARGTYSFSIDNVCTGHAQEQCDLEPGCAAELPGARIYRWTSLSGPVDVPGSHTVRVFREPAGGAPCYPPEGSELWLTVPFER